MCHVELQTIENKASNPLKRTQLESQSWVPVRKARGPRALGMRSRRTGRATGNTSQAM